jgi:hypothetical protein
MLHYETSIVIKRPVDQVFSYMTQIDNNEELAEDVMASWKLTEGPVGLGTMMTERVKVGLIQADIVWEITAFDINRLCTFEGETSIGRTLTSYRFQSAAGDTQVSAEVRVKLIGLLRLARPIVQFLHMRNRKRYLAMAKNKIENGQGDVENKSASIK